MSGKNHLFPAFRSAFDIYSFQKFLDLKKKEKKGGVGVWGGYYSIIVLYMYILHIFLEADSLIIGAVMESVWADMLPNLRK